MKQHWFKTIGWFYIPVHPMGYIITLIAIAFMIPVCMAVLRNGHSVSDEASFSRLLGEAHDRAAAIHRFEKRDVGEVQCGPRPKIKLACRVLIRRGRPTCI